MRKLIKIIKEKWLRQTSLTVLLVVITLAIFLGVNILIRKLDLSPIDFTKEKLYSLSDDSKNEVKNIDLNVTLYYFGYTEESTAVILGKQYHDINDKITVQLVNTSERPDLATQYGVSSTDQLVAIASNQRYKIIDASEMYTYDSSTYQSIDITEQKLTNGIIDVTIAKKPQVYFLTGHGEYGTGSNGYMYALAQQITNEVNDVNTLDLLLSDMPETCDVLIIANPTKDFTDLETEKIQNYINNGGKIIWMQEPYMLNSNTEELTNINKILSLYGISFSKGVVCEQSSSNMLAGSPELIIPEMSYNSIVKDIYTDGSIVMLDAGRINTVDDEKLEEIGVTATPFIKSSSNSFYRENATQSIYTKLNTDEEGPFVLGETLTKKINDTTTSTLVAYSNALFAASCSIQIGSSYTTPIALRNNKDLMLNTVAFLSNREDSIRIRKDTGVVTYTASQQQDLIVRAIIFGLPILVIIAGIIVTIVRKKKHRK